MRQYLRIGVVIGAILLLGTGSLYVLGYFSPKSTAIRLGISPYQDTAMPVITESTGIFKKHNLDVTLRTIQWEDVVPALASRGQTIDVAIGSINTFLPRAEAVNAGTSDPVVFYAPLYVFKGAAFVARPDSGLTPYSQLLTADHGNATVALQQLMSELRGKSIGYPSGTPYEQMFLQAERESGATPLPMRVRDVQLADGLPALLSGDLDVAAAGVTQQTEALKHGAYVLIQSQDLGLSEIIGLVTTKSFADSHPHQLEAMRLAWFDTIQALNSDPKAASSSVIAYLAANASTKYTYQEYMNSLSAQQFPATEAEADRLFEVRGSSFYWRRTWDNVNAYLMATGKIKTPVPYSFDVDPRARQ